MDANRFDRFTRILAEVLSRRGILGGLAASAGGLAALSGAGFETGLDAEAGKKSKRRRRRKKRKKKKCNKKPNKDWCGGKCRNITKNEKHCGECNNACEPDETCEDGTCVPPCIPDCTGAECGDSDGCGGTCDGTCPPGADVTCDVDTGTCGCDNPGNCCFDTDCAAQGPNFVCLSVNNVNNCFCDPDLLCGPVGNQVCCNIGQTCQAGTCVP